VDDDISPNEYPMHVRADTYTEADVDADALDTRKKDYFDHAHNIGSVSKAIGLQRVA